MQDHLDFTYNEDYFAELPELVEDLHNHGQHYVMIVVSDHVIQWVIIIMIRWSCDPSQDPGIGSDEPPGSYPPYDEGVQRNVFIKNSSGSLLIGKVC